MIPKQQFKPGFYRTRDGSKAEVLAERDNKLIGVMNKSVTWWGVNGKYSNCTSDHSCDLVAQWEEPLIVDCGWLIVHADHSVSHYERLPEGHCESVDKRWIAYRQIRYTQSIGFVTL